MDLEAVSNREFEREAEMERRSQALRAAARERWGERVSERPD